MDFRALTVLSKGRNWELVANIQSLAYLASHYDETHATEHVQKLTSISILHLSNFDTSV